LCALGVCVGLASAMLCGGSAASATVGTAASLASPSPMGPLRRFAANPRYFTANGKTAVYLTGAHTWPEVVDRGSSSPPPKFDYLGFLNKLRSWHHNFIRLWVLDNFRDEDTNGNGAFNTAPLPYARTGPGKALDGLAKFDLTRFDPQYFSRLRTRIVQARDRGIYVSVMLFEGYVVQLSDPPWVWDGNPMNPANNINRINGDLNRDGRGTEIYTLASRRITRIQEAYVKRVVKTVANLDNVLFEIGNEMGSYSTGFQYHFIRYIRSLERGQRIHHPIGMTFQYQGGSNSTLFRSPADWVSTRDSLTNPPIFPATKIVISDSDHHCGADCVDPDWVWRAFTRGQNVIYMDSWGTLKTPLDDPRSMSVRITLGLARQYALRMNLATMRPRTDICSTQFCLVGPKQVLVYQPDAGKSFTLSLGSGTAARYSVEWLNTANGTRVQGSGAQGGTMQLTPPFADAPAVAFLIRRAG
jgi:hypothetical protein